MVFRAAACAPGSFIMQRPIPSVSHQNRLRLFTRWSLRGKPNILPVMFAPHVLPAAREYDALYRSFVWRVPKLYNIGADVCDRWAAHEPRRTALFNVGSDGSIEEISYGA